MVERWSWVRRGRALVAAGVLAGALAGCGAGSGPAAGSTSTTSPATGTGTAPPVRTVPGMPPVVDSSNIYSRAGAGMLSATARRALSRVYVPDRQTNNVLVIDPATFKVVAAVPTGLNPQHVVPAYDFSRLWVVNNSEADPDYGTLTPIDPTTAKFGPSVRVEDPYNMYFTPDGAYAIVVAEALRRLDFRDPRTMALRFSLATPTCPGINHMDFSADGSYLIATCEDANRLVKIDWAGRRVVGTLDLGPGALPQDIRLSPDGRTFYVADMLGNRLIRVDGTSFSVKGSVDLAATGGFGAHGLYPSRDGRRLFVSNRGEGSITVISFRTRRPIAKWRLPGGGSPDMGGVSADGSQLWLSGRYDNKVYVFDTRTGHLISDISTTPAGVEPHGLCVWPQPGRYSLGHTGNTR